MSSRRLASLGWLRTRGRRFESYDRTTPGRLGHRHRRYVRLRVPNGREAEDTHHITRGLSRLRSEAAHGIHQIRLRVASLGWCQLGTLVHHPRSLQHMATGRRQAHINFGGILWRERLPLATQGGPTHWHADAHGGTSIGRKRYLIWRDFRRRGHETEAGPHRDVKGGRGSLNRLSRDHLLLSV